MKKRYTEEQIIGFLKKPTPISGRVTGVARLLVGCGVGLGVAFPAVTFASATNGSAELTFPVSSALPLVAEGNTK